MDKEVQETWKAMSGLMEPISPGWSPAGQTGGAFPAYLVGQLFDASLQPAGSPLCLCIATDFTLQFTFQFTNLQTVMISDHRLARSKPGWHFTGHLA